ncbi:MAG TPA: carboxypeptidase-like regulatory domain-containing protein, partial [Longimicrobiales bacterium]
MKKNPSRYLPLLLLPLLGLALAPAAQAQTPTVTGVVVSETGQPLRLVNVSVKGARVATASTPVGRYVLKVRSLQDTLVFSLLGYHTEVVPLNGRTQVNVQLAIEAVETEALVVTGYRAQEKATVTGSVTAVKSAEFRDAPADALSNALAGRLAGVSIQQNAGTPGRESSIRIRAVGTFNNSDPLYV